MEQIIAAIRITFISDEKGVPIVIDSFGKGVEFRERKDGQYVD